MMVFQPGRSEFADLAAYVMSSSLEMRIWNVSVFLDLYCLAAKDMCWQSYCFTILDRPVPHIPGVHSLYT